MTLYYTHQYGIDQYGTSQYGIGDVITDTSQESSTLRFQFNVAINGSVFTLTPKTVFNQFDEFGLISGTNRLQAESNAVYKRRIIDAFINQANSSYRGLINGITRGLGLSLFQPIVINPKRTLGDTGFLASDPYIKFDGVYLYLYSDYNNELLDYQVDRFEAGGNYEHLARLVEMINTTTFFEASLKANTEPYMKSMVIFNQSNRSVAIQGIPFSQRFKLDHKYIVQDSLISNNLEMFAVEVDYEDDVTSAGKYWIDYDKGIVRLYNIPNDHTSVRYEYIQYSFEPWASEVILYDINNENFKVKLFEQILQDDETYEHGLPTELGVDIINEILSVSPMYWGV